MRPLIAVLAALILLAAGPAAPVHVPQAQIDTENARWTALGVKLPPGGIVLEQPFSPPYSNRSFVVPYAWYQSFYTAMRARKDVPVDASALREDLPVLRLLLEKAYAGYEPASSHGWNWNKMFEDWNASLTRGAGRSLSLTQAFAPWGRLQDAQPDNLSGIPQFTAFADGSQSAQLGSRPVGPCSELRLRSGQTAKLSEHDAGQQPHAVQAWDGARFSPAWNLRFPKRLGAAAGVRCAGRTIALRAIPVVPASQTPVYQTLSDGIAYLRLPSFSDANADAIRAALSKAPQLGKERLVIFDLRGNTGGSAASDILTNWFAESAIENANPIAQTSTTSCFNTALSFNFEQQLTGGLKPPASSGLQQALQQLVDSLKGSATPDCAVQAAPKPADRSMRDHQFELHPQEQGQTRVVALVDSGCTAECEYLTYVLGGLPNTVIAGASTYGVLGFSQPGYFVLPHSRVPFRLALTRNDPYGDQRSVDGYGLTVDVVLPSAQSQSMQSLRALAQLLAT